MALNPLAYTEKVVQSFLRYQLTAYPFADPHLHAQMRRLLSLDTARETPLLKGPYVSLSRAFRAGAFVEKLVSEGILHPHMRELIPFETVYGHQEEAIRAIAAGRTTLISTSTGSGKSECFLYPIISRCLELRDQGAPAGICAVIVYPMNALAEDQLGRLRELLAGSGITFGMYVGKTPDEEAEVVGRRLDAGSSRSDYEAALRQARRRGEGVSIHPPEEVCSREVMRTAGRQPRILLTNVKQLELLLTRQSDVELFDDARLDFLVFDEAHTFTGAQGAESACLIRRLRSFCGRGPEATVCVATSATIVDKDNPDAARDFASRFFGVPRDEVVAVREVYEREVWAEHRAVPKAPANPAARLSEVLAAVDADDPEPAIRSAWRALAGEELPATGWAGALYDALSANELLYRTSELLDTPKLLGDLLDDLQTAVGRPVSEEELIIWLTLGAAARRDERPLVRPVVHGFVRGVPGAVVTFDGGDDRPVLHLSAEEEDETERKLRLRISTCNTCGQHYFEQALADFEYAGRVPGGGKASGEAIYWEPLEEVRGGVRVLLTDHLISSENDDEEEDHPKLSLLHFCRSCGAAHNDPREHCLACGESGPMVPLQAVQQKEDHPGFLTTCVCCGALGGQVGGRSREPIKPVRATNVADVHVLAQDMIHHAERRRLLIFADNRQDAAFQAGWMRDHARRFRLRAMIMRALEERPLSIGDLTHMLDAQMESDDALSQALLPEAWSVAPKEAGGVTHREERRYLLRILILREITMAAKQQIGLEPWGRLKVNYVGLEQSSPFVRHWSDHLGLPADELVGGIEAFLDQLRRKRLLYDGTGRIFSKIWAPGARELESGYLPYMSDVPKGIKLTREHADDRGRIVQLRAGTGHRTTASEIASKWGVSPDDVGDFLQDLWRYVTNESVALLVPVTLTGSRDNALPSCSGAHQIDCGKLMLAASKGVFRCKTCRRRTTRRTPRMRCLAWHCNGELEYLPEDKDNYDLQVLDQDYAMIRPREHTAMVPHQERETIEQIFKGESETINALVCTQTLELGVDIGALDAVLMRNVPPLPANYWQRSGRAGRRHRMAANLTYCRATSHDRAYFAEPLKLLGGRVDPPSFNLSNELLVAKHVHANVISSLHQLARPGSGLPDADREEVSKALETALPTFVRDYLFTVTGEVRPRPREVGCLHTVITKHKERIEQAVSAAFQQGWPDADAAVADSGSLAEHVLAMTGELETVILRLYRRLHWALKQMRILENRRVSVGALDEEQDAYYQRCKWLVQRLKGTSKRKRSEAEGFADTITMGVLASEGFLPGYGLDIGSVLGMAEVPRYVRGLRDFDLPRVPSVAVREYVPGNLIYANGQRFVPKFYAREAGEEKVEAVHYEVNIERQAVRECLADVSGDPTAAMVTSIPICDVHLIHASRISDEEENRFQMGVSLFGREGDRHNGGQAYTWGPKAVHLRRGVHLHLVNVGANIAIRGRREFGYPVCRVCGQSVSPLSSQRQRDEFVKAHRERCSSTPLATAFHADLVVDALTIASCASQDEAYSMAEAIRFAATQILDMELDDLQVLVIGCADRDEMDAMLYDPMPGGSGLLQQICRRFGEIVAEARRIAADCPSRCPRSCIDCFQRYRNAFYHKYLDRHLVLERLSEWGSVLEEAQPIPPKMPAREPAGSAQPVNVAERKLRAMLQAAGLPEGQWQLQRMLPRPLGSTTPDITFDDPDDEERKIFVYLDGLSEHIHGNPKTAAMDRQIRAELRSEGHEVVVITAAELDDRIAMTRHFKRLARQLVGRDAVDRVADEAGTWFVGGDDGGSS